MKPEVNLREVTQIKQRKQFLLKTKGCCFLCLELIEFKKEEEEESRKSETENETSILLKSLNRFLKINSGEFIATEICADFPPQEHQNEEEIKVDLCESCARITTKFTKTFATLEMVQAEVHYWLGRIHRQISEGSKRPELVQIYSKRMTSEPESLKQLASVDKLRREISKKSAETKNHFDPKVQLFRLKNPEKYCRAGSAKEAEQQPTSPAPSLDHSGNEWESGYDVEKSPLPLLENEIVIKTDEMASNTQNPTTSTTFSESATNRKRKRFNYNSTSGKYECVACPKAFGSRTTAFDHYSSVHLKRIYKCESCDAILKHESSLARHRKICSGIRKKALDRKFACSACCQRFTASSSLRTHHKTVHLNQRNFSCDICSRTFKHSSNLKAHKAATHFGRRFQCKTCNKPFKWKRDRKAHESNCRSSDDSINQLLKIEVI